MHKFIVTLLVLFSLSFNLNAQELNCLITVNHDQIRGSNKQVFTTLQKSLNEFVNQTKWTERVVKPEERVDCAMTIIVTKREDNNFEASLQVQSTRPVFNSTYTTPVLNIRDNDFSFKYNEFDPLIYNKNAFDSNLISTIVFYVYTVLGVDADTFSKNGGEIELKEAQNVMLQAQQSGLSSWQNVVGKQNRFLLIDNLLSPELRAYRTVMYDYHIKALDNFSLNKSFAKQSVEDAIFFIEKIHNKTIGNYLLRIFFDAKAEEIVNVYSDGPKTRNLSRFKTILRKISPNNSSKWSKL